MRTQTVILGSVLALGLAAVGVTVAPIGDVKPLVQNIAKGSKAEEPQPVVAEPEPAQAPGTSYRSNTPALEHPGGVGNEGGTDENAGNGSNTQEPPAPTTLDLAPPTGQALSFVGDWAQESEAHGKRVRVHLTLEDDGAYRAVASLFPIDDVEAEPERSISTGGRWSFEAGSIVLARLDSDAPEAFPTGWREVYWDSRIDGTDWVYTDADGLARALIRRRANPL